MQNILHLTTHLGGGIGKFLSDALEHEVDTQSKFTHQIIMLENPSSIKHFDKCIKNNIKARLLNDVNMLKEHFKSTDIVLLHWWHHPLMAKLLNQFPQIPIRLIVMSHISGCNYPMLPLDFVKRPHKILFTTKYTLDNPYWNEQERKEAKEKAEVIYGLGRLDDNPIFKKTTSDDFVIGYVGTLNFSKLHPDFIKYCQAVVRKIPHARFVMVGDMSGTRQIMSQAKDYGIDGKFEFTGFVNNIDEQLERFNIFASPLNPYHFGTTENAILEPMSRGLPVVCLNQCTEKYLITHNETGLLANSIEDYATLIEYLYNNPAECERLGKNGAAYAKKEFSLSKNISKMHKVLSEVLNYDKRLFQFNDIFGTEPYEWFLSCLGNDKQLFLDSINPDIISNVESKNKTLERMKNCRPILKEKAKSSIRHFANYFSEDVYLKYWEEIVLTCQKR